MNIIETTLLFFPTVGVVVGAGVGIGRAEDSTGQMLGFTYGVLAGGVGGVMAHFALWGGIVALLYLVEWWRPGRPTCRQGCCHSQDYSLDRFVPEDSRWMVHCRCGDRYVEDAPNRRFLRVEADGSLHPFRRHRPLGRAWLPDEGA